MKGILMTPENIRATMEGGKTQTRRLDGLKEINKELDRYRWTVQCCKTQVKTDWVSHFWLFFDKERYLHKEPIKVEPRYRVGEVVYIKEAYWEDSGDIYYKLDFPLFPKDMPTNMFFEKGKWQSPLFLPEIFARYFIKITDVRPERLQDITEEDAIAEGIIRSTERYLRPTARQQYAQLWDSINMKRRVDLTTNLDTVYPYSWRANPWIWRYQYVLLTQQEARRLQ
jgi:hypothetical protein